MLLFFFFFFQAEDGIRDRNVTGVQTCALPIYGGRIVNISTDGTHMGFSGATVYLGSKGALEQFTKGLAHELAPKIGRASCRERVLISEVGGSLKKKN